MQAVAIVSVGHRLDPSTPKHRALLEAVGAPASSNEVGALEGFYELTCDGEPLNLNEYGTWIADPRVGSADSVLLSEALGRGEGDSGGPGLASSTHVIVMNDC